MPGDAARYSASRGNDVDIDVAVEMSAVGDLRAVRRKEGSGDYLAIGSQALSLAALAADGPNVIGVAEGDFVLRK